MREAEEEIGLKAADVSILGRLDDVQTLSGYSITPVVGVFPWAYSFFVSTIEVERVFTIPLRWLEEPKHYRELLDPKTGFLSIAYHPFDGELLWGATARITLNFIRTIFG